MFKGFGEDLHELVKKANDDSFQGDLRESWKLEEHSLAQFTRQELKVISQPRKMTFVQLNDLINELASTKLEIDVKHLETRLPKRTMEGHLHEVFKTKFGLRNMIVENLTSFLYTLKYYASYDTRAKTFLAILRNECEEEFLQVIETVEKSLLLLLRVALISLEMFIYGGSPYAQVQEVNQIVKEKLNGHLTISEANEIVRYLYSQSDAKDIISRIDREKEYPPENRVLTTREEQIVDRQKSTTPLINYNRFRRVGRCDSDRDELHLRGPSEVFVGLQRIVRQT